MMNPNTTFNNISVISWRSALLVEETGGPRENGHMVVGVTTTYAISAYDVVSSNLDQGEVYNIM
jgi:hypothetical protein